MKRSLFLGICLLAMTTLSFTQEKWYEIRIQNVSETGKADGKISITVNRESETFIYSVYAENKGPWEGFDPLFTSGELTTANYEFLNMEKGKYVIYIQLSDGVFAGEPVVVK
jgi:hypothetical protein